MADDGMLLNFELPTDAFNVKQKTIRGGRWKERLTAKKSAAYGQRKQQERLTTRTPRFSEVASEEEELILPESQNGVARPAKRLRTEDAGSYRAGGHDGQRRMQNGSFQQDRTPFVPSRSGGNGKPAASAGDRPFKGPVISSLFTYNPTSTTKSEPRDLQTDETVTPSNAPLDPKLASFTEMGLSETLASHLLNKLNISAPTAIQRKAVTQLCKSHSDAFIQAETGSGKTLSYLLPVVQQISNLSRQMKDAGQEFGRESGLFAVVLAPTRELSKQISTVLDSLLSCCHWVVGGTVIGGEKKKSEKARLRKGVNILVATPGRLADHLNNTEVLDVSKVRWLVLDEGDRLMELGFEQDIQKIVSVMNLRSRKAQETPIPGLPEQRTTILCSATIKANVDHLRSIALKDPVMIAIDPAEKEGETGDEAFSAPSQLKQSYAVVPPKQRLVALVAVLKQAFKRKGTVMKCILFMSCADTVDFHFEAFTRSSEKKIPEDTINTSTKLSKSDKIPQGNTIAESRTDGLATMLSNTENPVQIFRLHGSLQQATRTSTLKAFTNCSDPSILVCTDVASRGLDLPNIDLVIEYDAPFSKEDHLHRIGRTARAGRDGRAMIFLMPGCEEGYVEILKEGRPRNLTRHDGDELLRKGFAPSSGVVGGNDWADAATQLQLDLERWTIENPKHLEQARRAFQSHIRAYATHVAAERKFFDLKQLHLGHLAKAFALRDKPGTIKVPGQRPGKAEAGKNKAARRSNAGAANMNGKRKTGDDDDVPEMTDEQEARRKMRMKMKAMSGASEFNLG